MAKSKAQLKPKFKKGNPSIQQVPAWKEPYPAPDDETMVRAIPTQDIKVNGHHLPIGVECVLSTAMAHAHAAALASPKE